MGWDSLLRKAILLFAGNRLVSRLFGRFGMRLGASRFVAAETLEDTVAKVRELNAQGLLVTLDYLGESVRERELALAAADMIVHTLHTIHRFNLQANVSVKLTQLGLHLEQQFCLQLMERICSEAKALNNFVRIDMEDSSVTQSTVDIFRKLLAAYGRETVGLVIQSYLYRSLSDVSELGDLGANLRIVKGAYKESGKVAYLRKADVNQNYVKLVKMHLGKGCYTAVATHDSKIINEVKHYINVINISKNWFEFQMLYGIATNLQLQLAGEGYRVRVYTPFGKHWYPYFTRRIAERPANLFFVLKHLFRKR